MTRTPTGLPTHDPAPLPTAALAPEARRAALLDQLLYLRDELALVEALLPRLPRPLLEERPRPDTPSFAETLLALARADTERLATLGVHAAEASGAPAPQREGPEAGFEAALALFVSARTALHAALADRVDEAAPLPSGVTVEAFMQQAVLDDSAALRTIAAFLFEAQKR